MEIKWLFDRMERQRPYGDKIVLPEAVKLVCTIEEAPRKGPREFHLKLGVFREIL